MNGTPLESSATDTSSLPLITPKRDEEKKPSFGSSVLFWIKDTLIVLFFGILFSLIVKTFLLQTFFIPSGSMEKTLQIQDRIVVSMLSPQPFGLNRGDVVVFDDSKNWLPPMTDAQANPGVVKKALSFIGVMPDATKRTLVKRVIGLPGDHVSCCDAQGRVSVNGKVLNETYINPAENPVSVKFDVVVPEGKIWVMGDNRNYSGDSRAHMDVDGGFVDISDVEGKTIAIAWPVQHVSGIDSHPEVFADIPPASK